MDNKNKFQQGLLLALHQSSIAINEALNALDKKSPGMAIEILRKFKNSTAGYLAEKATASILRNQSEEETQK